MSTRTLLTIAAWLMALPGLFLLFAPDVALSLLAWSPEPSAELFAQITGTLACAIGLCNWMARGTIIGGIYGRPLLVMNIFAYCSAGLSLLKTGTAMDGNMPLLVVGGLWSGCGLAFGRLLFTHPGP